MRFLIKSEHLARVCKRCNIPEALMGKYPIITEMFNTKSLDYDVYVYVHNIEDMCKFIEGLKYPVSIIRERALGDNFKTHTLVIHDDGIDTGKLISVKEVDRT